MAQGATPFCLSAAARGACDASNKGLSVKATARATLLKSGSFNLAGGNIEIGRDAALDRLQPFTLEATVAPRQIAGDRHNIIEAQTPAVTLLIAPDGCCLRVYAAGGNGCGRLPSALPVAGSAVTGDSTSVPASRAAARR